MKRSVTALIAAALAASVASQVSVRAQEQRELDPLIVDSLAALDSLVAPDTAACSLRDAADGDAANNVELPYVFCDDGVVPRGGGASGIPVPVAYEAPANGNQHAGLPPPATAEQVAARSSQDLRPESDGRRITLDVDVTLPAGTGIAAHQGQDWPTSPRPKGGYPVIVFMHGCCGGNKASWEAASVDAPREQWHHSNAWFASRGYVVVNYTARGFRDNQERGSTGTTQLDSRRYEINDYQYLVGLLADHDARHRAEGLRPVFDINPRKIGVVGGSYGGGFAFMAWTDPRWKSPETRTIMKLGAVVPKYGWTDLVESLVPSGHYLDRDPDTNKTAIAPTSVAGAASRHPLGVVKQSIVAGLYATGNLVTGNHTTFPDYIHDAYARLQQGEPYDSDEFLQGIVDTFLADRSAYFQNRFWRKVRKGRVRVPAYVAATWTDPLFPPMESVRFYNKLKRVAPDYPVEMYFGDYQHFVANKAKEWDDLCGDDHHVCTIEDYRKSDGSLNLNKAATRVRKGVNTRINYFLDNVLRGKGRPLRYKVTATTTICPANATEKLPVDEPGIEYRAPTWRGLAPSEVFFGWTGGGTAATTTVTAATDPHASEADPVVRDRHSDKCFTTDQISPGAGVVQYVSDPIEKTFTMMGLPRLELDYTTTATDYWIAARLYDLADGSMTMVTRGVCKVSAGAEPDVGCSTFELFGNGWTFEEGHQMVLELSQADSPFLRKSNFPSSIQFSDVRVTLPTTSEGLRRDFRDG